MEQAEHTTPELARLTVNGRTSRIAHHIVFGFIYAMITGVAASRLAAWGLSDSITFSILALFVVIVHWLTRRYLVDQEVVANVEGLAQYANGRLRRRIRWAEIRGMNVFQHTAPTIKEGGVGTMSLQDEFRVFAVQGPGITVRIGGLEREDSHEQAIRKIADEWRKRHPEAAALYAQEQQRKSRTH